MQSGSVLQGFDLKGRTFNGYLALPEAGRGAGLLVFHAWWGLNDFILQTCDKLARSGFTTLAPDYYAGNTAKTIEDARTLKQQMDRKATNQLVALAADYLVQELQVETPRLGALGFSLGAGFALEAARSRSQFVKAVVLFYGTGGGKLDKTDAVFMGHFAEDDLWGAHPKKVDALAERIRVANREEKFFTYPNTKHWFLETDRPEYDQVAAELAWARTVTFLQNQLG
ncbi:MAG: dienelactone hydrolase family protein [Anaerolineales bacterium]